MTKLKEIENDDELAGGVIERRVLEECKAMCTECNRYTCGWTDYDTALDSYIAHREKVHRRESVVRNA